MPIGKHAGCLCGMYAVRPRGRYLLAIWAEALVVFSVEDEAGMDRCGRHGLSRSFCLIHMHLDFGRSVKMAAESRPSVESRLIVIFRVHNEDSAPEWRIKKYGKVSVCYLANVN